MFIRMACHTDPHRYAMKIFRDHKFNPEFALQI